MLKKTLAVTVLGLTTSGAMADWYSPYPNWTPMYWADQGRGEMNDRTGSNMGSFMPENGPFAQQGGPRYDVPMMSYHSFSPDNMADNFTDNFGNNFDNMNPFAGNNFGGMNPFGNNSFGGMNPFANNRRYAAPPPGYYPQPYGYAPAPYYAPAPMQQQPMQQPMPQDYPQVAPIKPAQPRATPEAETKPSAGQQSASPSKPNPSAQSSVSGPSPYGQGGFYRQSQQGQGQHFNSQPVTQWGSGQVNPYGQAPGQDVYPE